VTKYEEINKQIKAVTARISVGLVY